MVFVSKNIKKLICYDIIETIWEDKGNLICPICKKNNIVELELFSDLNFERKLSLVNTVCRQCGDDTLNFFYKKKEKPAGIILRKINKDNL